MQIHLRFNLLTCRNCNGIDFDEITEKIQSSRDATELHSMSGWAYYKCTRCDTREAVWIANIKRSKS